jgi:hypothetical protein
MKSSHLLVVLAVGMMPAIPLSAAVLDFTNATCSGGLDCVIGSPIDQDYGDIAGVNVVYDGDSSDAALQPALFWTTGYETLENVAYTSIGATLSILFEVSGGAGVSVSSFDIAPYLDRTRDTSVTVTDVATGAILFSAVEAPISTEGVTTYTGEWVSTAGIRIDFGPDAFDVGIDNIVYEAVIPVPAAGVLMLSALLGVGAMGRRRA